MSGLTILRIISLVTWSGLLIYMLPGAWSALRGGVGARRGDPMRLGTASVCLIFICGTLRWLIAPESEALLIVIQVASIGVGGFVFWLARAYGRGPRV